MQSVSSIVASTHSGSVSNLIVHCSILYCVAP